MLLVSFTSLIGTALIDACVCERYSLFLSLPPSASFQVPLSIAHGLNFAHYFLAMPFEREQWVKCAPMIAG